MDIFVGSLPFKLKENQLRELFEKYGEVTAVTIVVNHITRQNKGYGFVEMADEKQAYQAIKALNGTELGGRKIIVSPQSAERKEHKRRK